jgi:hypothetical protein
MGTLSCLNVAGGDVKISFDKSDIGETIRAKRIITDMLRRGYALLIEVNGAYQRAVSFDESAGEYIIADYEPQTTNEIDPPTARLKDAETAQETAKPSSKKGKVVRQRFSMETTNAVGIARSAGG